MMLSSIVVQDEAKAKFNESVEIAINLELTPAAATSRCAALWCCRTEQGPTPASPSLLRTRRLIWPAALVHCSVSIASPTARLISYLERACSLARRGVCFSMSRAAGT